MSKAVQFRRRKQADVVVVSKVLHHRIDEMSRRNSTPRAKLGRDGHIKALRGAEEKPVRQMTCQRRRYVGTRYTQQFGRFSSGDCVASVRKQPVCEVPRINRRFDPNPFNHVHILTVALSFDTSK